MKRQKKNSHTGNRTRIGRVRACYPNLLDYMGPVCSFYKVYTTNRTTTFNPTKQLFISTMPIDINLLRVSRGGNPDLVRKSQKDRFASVELVDEVIALDDV